MGKKTKVVINTNVVVSAFGWGGKPVNIIGDDTEDNKILECAISAGAEFVVSGDKHLLTLKSFEGIKIVTPEEFIKIWSFTK